jgi:hypothetical protein
MSTTLVRKVDIDDSGDNLSGTIHNNAWLQDLQQRIDNALIGNTMLTVTPSGVVNDWDPGIVGDTTIVIGSNTANLTVTGFAPAGGAKPGQRLLVINSGAYTVGFKYNSTGSAAGNRLLTYNNSDMLLSTGGGIANGFAQFTYAAYGARWVMTGFSQGDPIAFTPFWTFGASAAGFTYSTQVGLYTLANGVLWYSGRLSASTKGTTSGVASLNGFPMYSSASAGSMAVLHVGYAAGFNGLGGNFTGYMTPGGIALQLTTAVSTGVANIGDGNFNAATDVIFSGSYRAY